LCHEIAADSKPKAADSVLPILALKTAQGWDTRIYRGCHRRKGRATRPETVTPQTGGTACTSYSETGDGSLNGNGQFSDRVSLCSNSPIPACDKKYTQVIKVAGYPQTILGARTNTLEFTNTQLNYTNRGPTQ